MTAVVDLRLDGQAAIVTGASAGLGAIIARGLADALDRPEPEGDSAG